MERMLNKLIRFPKTIIVVLLIITIAFFMVMKENSRMETDLDKYMPQNHPAFIYSDSAEEIFNIQDGIIIAIENPKGVYQTGTLQKIKDLTIKLGKMPEIDKNDVTSLYTADNIIGTEDGMDVKAFFKKVPDTESGLQEIAEKVRNNEMIFGRLVSQNETVSVIIAEIGDDVFSQEFYHQILELVHSYEGPEKLYVAGVPIVEGTMAYLGPKDMQKMVPIVMAVIILVLLIVLKSFKNMISTMLVVTFSVVWAFGLMAALHIPIYAVSTMIPVMLIAIGVADGIHLYSHLDLFLKKNPKASRREAVTDMLKNMWKPVVMTSVTTSVGFISLLTSEVFSIKYFGVFTAFGVIAAMLFSLILIPSTILVFGFPKRKRKVNSRQNPAENTLSSRFAEGVIKHKTITLFLTIIIVATSVYGITKVWINSSFLDKFEKDSDIVLTDAFINENFGGTSNLNVILEGAEDVMKSPAAMKLIDKLQDEVESRLEVVGNSFSLADYLKRMNKVMHADKQEFETIPDSKELNAQYLLLYEMSGDPENLWKVVDYDYKTVNVTIQLKSDNSKAINSAIAVVEEYSEDFEKLGITVNYAGSGYKGLVFTDLILEGQIKSLIMSLFIIIILLTLMFKNLLAGLIGSVPIVITAVIGFGVMGLLKIPLSTTTALISSIAIGIGIDYAVHFIERYKINAAATGDKLLTMQKTMHHSGRAIIFNATVVIAGFLVLLFSVFPPNRSLGALVSLNMFTSFLGTVTIMYLLLYKTNLFFRKK
ncbi:MAG: MMPL family transporter [Candidatus Cloacimonetes bacterium]|nr:MMPL family transporter [Candidatus Cloacimonadota bacterium]MCF7813006.1 MMPL family transporter [Candidatus Cloacimonadota bacterium]MCF7867262.1 MMPL family transporter [Candidatus Cloacimonadota bacterium]MCF7882706.1 MMPL family transporter [Candidatus Cloacimonadota bacterium]